MATQHDYRTREHLDNTPSEEVLLSWGGAFTSIGVARGTRGTPLFWLALVCQKLPDDPLLRVDFFLPWKCLGLVVGDPLISESWLRHESQVPAAGFFLLQYDGSVSPEWTEDGKKEGFVRFTGSKSSDWCKPMDDHVTDSLLSAFNTLVLFSQISDPSISLPLYLSSSVVFPFSLIHSFF